MNLKNCEVRPAKGSHHLYGPETFQKVAEHTKDIA